MATNASRRQFVKALAALVPAASWSGVACIAEQANKDSPPELAPLLLDAEGNRITTVSEWQARRSELVRRWREVLGEIPRDSARPPELTVLEEETLGDVRRQLIEYETEPGVTVEAYLLTPTETSGRRPAVVVFHSTVAHSIRQPAGVKGMPVKAFGLELAKRGYVALCPRNYLWPDNHRISTGRTTRAHFARHPDVKGMAKMLHDGQVAIDILSSLAQVDPERLAAVGHSLGAKEVLYLAAFDPRTRVAVSSEGGIGMSMSNWDAAWYLGADFHEQAPDLRHHQLLAMAAPRPFLLIGGNSADGEASQPYIDAAQQVYSLYGAGDRLELFNHGQGHSMPPEAAERTYQWITRWLPSSDS